MIHVFIGTKAQLIKMAPIMKEMQNRGIEYNFIFSGQHQNTINDIRKNFGIKKPDYILHNGKDVTSVASMFFWMMKIVFIAIKNKKMVWKDDINGVVLNHGDTFSTLLGSILAKLFRFKNAHVESGLRSFNLFHPFPEELTRLIVFRLSDIFFVPGSWALSNIENFSGEKINIEANTLYDSLNNILIKEQEIDIKVPQCDFAVVSLHRFENLSKKTHFESLITKLERISKSINLIFILHKPTEKKLREFALYERLNNADGIELRPRYDYETFIFLISLAKFVVSDGGSNQEECYYLGKPCLLFRNATERKEGLGENVLLSKFDDDVIDNFVSSYHDFKRDSLKLDFSPTDKIIDYLTSSHF